jgi:hypothetical protein
MDDIKAELVDELLKVTRADALVFARASLQRLRCVLGMLSSLEVNVQEKHCSCSSTTLTCHKVMRPWRQRAEVAGNVARPSRGKTS